MIRELKMPCTTVWRVLCKQPLMKPCHCSFFKLFTPAYHNTWLHSVLENDSFGKHAGRWWFCSWIDVQRCKLPFTWVIKLTATMAEYGVLRTHPFTWKIRGIHPKSVCFAPFHWVRFMVYSSMLKTFQPGGHIGIFQNYVICCGSTRFHFPAQWDIPSLLSWWLKLSEWGATTLHWIGMAVDRIIFLAWPLHSPNLMPCDIFSWGYLKHVIFILPSPIDLNNLTLWIRNAINTINDTLCRVWQVAGLMSVMWLKVHTHKICEMNSLTFLNISVQVWWT